MNNILFAFILSITYFFGLQIRDSPTMSHHKYIEFYDVRAAESALRALNRSDIAGKQIKLERGRLGGSQRCKTQKT